MIVARSMGHNAAILATHGKNTTFMARGVRHKFIFLVTIL